MNYKVFCKFIKGFGLSELAYCIRFAFPCHINYTLKQNANCCLKNIYSLFIVHCSFGMPYFLSAVALTAKFISKFVRLSEF